MISNHQNPFTAQTISSVGDNIVDKCMDIIAAIC